jgi:hypothetical protein
MQVTAILFSFLSLFANKQNYETMKINVFKLAVLCSMLLVFTQCRKSNDEILIKEGVKKGEVTLTNAELNIVPYQLNDSVVFRDSIGNSHTFKVSYRETHFNRTFKDGGTDNTTDYYEIENLSVWLSDNNGYYIRLELTAPLPQYCSNQWINKNYFVICFEPAYAMDSTFFRSTFPNYVDTTDFYYTLNGVSIPYHSSITIFNKTFSSVYELISYNDNASENYIQRVYYTTSQGIVGYQTKGGKDWCLDN